MGKFDAHPLCRPPRDAVAVPSDYDRSEKLWRLGNDGKWREDNMQPGLAFVGRVPGESGTMVWTANCRCPYPSVCPAGVAGDFVFHKLDIQSTTFERRRAYPSPIVAKAKKKPRKR